MANRKLPIWHERDPVVNRWSVGWTHPMTSISVLQRVASKFNVYEINELIPTIFSVLGLCVLFQTSTKTDNVDRIETGCAQTLATIENEIRWSSTTTTTTTSSCARLTVVVLVVVVGFYYYDLIYDGNRHEFNLIID